ncbi:MAG: dihydropteroate synthase [Candidatus Eremiobacteraeota bacterium]|nr:dihydropteroate synthase [Candidatus Eremiobacteraeota bacterium]
MGIVNVAPDSFSGDGAADALRAFAQRDAGADLLDVGAESTRPGHEPIDERTELERLLPVLETIRCEDERTIVSVDTFKPEVFRRAHAAGADILNSIWGLDDALLETALECDVPVVAMHNKSVALYERSVVDEVVASLDGLAQRAVARGLRPERLILDPGIGFGKLPEHNVAILASLDRIVALGFPTLVGTSRKSTIGKLTGKPVEDRVYGTAATLALAVAAGVDIVRVHDVAAARDVVAVADAIVRGWRPPGWSETLP